MTTNGKIILVAGVSLVILALGLFWWSSKPEVVVETKVESEIPEEVVVEPVVKESLIGSSVEGRSIYAYTIGTGDRHLLFVGGMHGGYEWNSVLLAYEILDHLTNNPDLIDTDLTVSIIPSLNPDGLYEIIGKEGRFAATDVPADTGAKVGRFNANDVDLNRNFDCKWQPESTWRGATVSAGTSAFSEPEAKALRDFVLNNNPDGVVFWHSQANAVYASECEAGILPMTRELMNIYATAANYKTVDVFDAYPVTGDAEGWLASIGIPAITVELASHASIEWLKNYAGVAALISAYAK